MLMSVFTNLSGDTDINRHKNDHVTEALQFFVKKRNFPSDFSTRSCL